MSICNLFNQLSNSEVLSDFRNLTLISFIIFFAVAVPGQNNELPAGKNAWVSDNGDGTYQNPVLYADYSDPDVIRVGEDFYMVSSSFSHFPGIPVLHSKDLVNWKIITHIVSNYDFGDYSKPVHGHGIWAPGIRFHNGEFYVYFGDPDVGIIMTKAKNPAGPWEPLRLVREAKGWIDPCPFWDEDGNAYLVHAWSHSRSGIKSILTLNKMSGDGEKILDEGTMIFDGRENHPTMEGPKIYKRNGYYYIFAPAGGITPGWQTVLRSKNIYGPYEDKIVLEQGSTDINGPHQGAWVELENGESWFLHFQENGPYGRIVHMNPVKWENDWPVMGIDFDGNGIGEPVRIYNKPAVRKHFGIEVPQTSDEFDSTGLGLQWQWEGNWKKEWYSLTENPGNLRLFSVARNTENIYNIANVVGQKFPAEEFNFTVKLSFDLKTNGERTGVVILGTDYAGLTILKNDGKYILQQVTCFGADKDSSENINSSVVLNDNSLFLKVYVRKNGRCSFAYSPDGKTFTLTGEEFTAVRGRYVGTKIGLFAVSPVNAPKTGYCDYDWIRFEPVN